MRAIAQHRSDGAFQEKAGMSQDCFSLSVSFSFLWIPCIRAGPPLSPSFHPHSWLSDFRSVHGGRSQFSRCCYLIIDLGSRLSTEAHAPRSLHGPTASTAGLARANVSRFPVRFDSARSC